MYIFFTVRYSGKVPGPYEGMLNQREFNNILKRAWEAVGNFWHAKFLPLHFDQNAAKRYDYTARTFKYTRYKIKKYGHSLPLVWTGASRILARIRRVTATFRGVTVALQCRGLARRPKGGVIRMFDEVKKVIPGEIIELKAEHRRVTQRQLGAIARARFRMRRIAA